MRHLVSFFIAIATIGQPTGSFEAELALSPYFRDLRTVQVTSAGRRLTLLFDTGGGATLISPQAAAALGCTPHGRDVGHRMTGEAVVFQRCESLSISSGAWAQQLSPIGVFDVGALLPKELPPVDGVLALDAFRGRVITIDWARDKIGVWARGTGPRRDAVTPHRAATGESGRFLSVFVPIPATQGLLWFLLDSGNIRGTLVADSVIKEGLLRPTATGTVRMSVAGGSAIDMPYTAAALDIDGALGTDFLKRFPVTLDLRGGGS